MEKIRSFTQLVAWQKAHVLVLDIYRVTKSFPKEETYLLVDQMRRAAVSISSNIAEGFSRRTKNDKVHFYVMSLTSSRELQNQLLISRDLLYLAKNLFTVLAEQTVEVNKLLNGLISKTSHSTY